MDLIKKFIRFEQNVKFYAFLWTNDITIIKIKFLSNRVICVKAIDKQIRKKHVKLEFESSHSTI